MKRLISLNVWGYFLKVILPIVIVTVVSLPLPLIIGRMYQESFMKFVGLSVFTVVQTLIVILLIGLSSDEKKMLASIPVIQKIIKKGKNNSLSK